MSSPLLYLIVIYWFTCSTTPMQENVYYELTFMIWFYY